MKAEKLCEDDADKMLRGAAMRENKKIVEIARSVITAAEMFK